MASSLLADPSKPDNNSKSDGGDAAPQLASERQSVDLTVYNSNLALIREERTLPLKKGVNKIIVPDVPATIDATSLHFSSLTDANSVKVLEQNYQYDLLNQYSLLEKYLGRDVEFLRLDSEKKKEISVQGKLLSVDANLESFSRGGEGANLGMVAEVNGKVEINPIGRLTLPHLPSGLIIKPQLQWSLNVNRDGDQKAAISYLANSISWKSDYVLLLDKGDQNIDLKGWVTLTNLSGTGFKNAGLKLVAGDVHQVQEERPTTRYKAKMVAMADGGEQFVQKDLFEYKIYSLQRRVDIKTNETKQIELISAPKVPAKKIMVYDGLEQGWQGWMANENYRNQNTFGQQGNTKVGVYLTFKNDQKSGLAIPLPAGKVRVYKLDEDNREQFIGEDQIAHTPKDEPVRLFLGNAFDLVGSRAQKDFRLLSSKNPKDSLTNGRGAEETFEIKIRNHKKETVEVEVYEHPWRWNQWDLVSSTVAGEKIDQNTLRFILKIPADKERTVVYKLRYIWD